MIDFKGQKVSWVELSEISGIPISTLFNRYQAGLRDDLLISKKHRGAKNKMAASKLTSEKVKTIKFMLKESNMTQTQIAKQFSVDPSHISDIKRGKKWIETEI